MKRIFLLSIPFAICCATSCNNNKSSDTTVATDTITSSTTTVDTTVSTSVALNPQPGTGVVVKSGELPAPVQEAFDLKYPKATASEWLVYTPTGADEDLELSAPYYYTKVNEGGKEYWIWYNDKGMWVKNVSLLPKDQRLPDAVNKTISNLYPGYAIEEISKENDKDMQMYEIKLNKGDQKAKVKVLPDGTVFKRKEKTK